MSDHMLRQPSQGILRADTPDRPTMSRQVSFTDVVYLQDRHGGMQKATDKLLEKAAKSGEASIRHGVDPNVVLHDKPVPKPHFRLHIPRLPSKHTMPDTGSTVSHTNDISPALTPTAGSVASSLPVESPTRSPTQRRRPPPPPADTLGSQGVSSLPRSSDQRPIHRMPPKPRKMGMLRPLEPLDDDTELYVRKLSEFTIPEYYHDFVYVAVLVQLAVFVGLNTDARSLFEAFLLFASYFCTWFHMVFLRARFNISFAWHIGIFLIQGSTMLMSLATVRRTALSTVSNGLEDKVIVSALSAAVPRLVFAGTYASIFFRAPPHRNLAWKAFIFLGLSSALLLLAAALDDESGTLIVFSLAICFELGLYAAIFFQNTSTRTVIHVDQLIQRLSHWLHIALGVSLVTITTSVLPSHTFENNLTGILCFAVLFFVYIHVTLCEPAYLSSMDTHALDLSPTRGFLFIFCSLFVSASLLGVSGGIKGLVEASSRTLEKQALLFTVSLATGLFVHCGSTLLHEFARQNAFCLKTVGRTVLWLLKVGISAAIAPLGLLIRGTNGLEPYQLLIVVLVFLATLCILDATLQPTTSLLKALRCHHVPGDTRSRPWEVLRRNITNTESTPRLAHLVQTAIENSKTRQPGVANHNLNRFSLIAQRNRSNGPARVHPNSATSPV